MPMLHQLKKPAGLALATAALVATLAPTKTSAQDLHPSRRPSPMGIARTFVDDGYVSVTYSRPYKRGREIFGSKESGAVVPYGELWRTGANEATQITLTKDLMVAGQKLPAGTYSLFTIPGEKQWQVQFNTALGLNGTRRRNPASGEMEEAYKVENNVVTVTVPVGATKEEIDQFTITFEDREGGKDLVLRWITTEIHVPLAKAG